MIDAAAFKELYKVVYVDLYRFALCMMQHQQDAEDAVSEAVILAYENIHKLRKEEAFRSWIFQILANVCRKKLKSRERTEVELQEEYAVNGPGEGLRVDVQRAFLILDEEDRLIVSMSVFGGYNSQEIGKMLKMNPSTVRSRRKRSLEKMSWILKE